MIKDYDLEILYHPGKANVVADALSRKPVSVRMLESLTTQSKIQKELIREGIEVCVQRSQGKLSVMEITSSLTDEIKSKQLDDPLMIRFLLRRKLVV